MTEFVQRPGQSIEEQLVSNADVEIAKRMLAEKAARDQVVGINVAPIEEREVGGKKIGLWAAEIPGDQQVGAHAHFEGDEWYRVIEGTGLMYTGKAQKVDEKTVEVVWDSPLSVQTGDIFPVKESYAHSLKNTQPTPLIIVFSGPPEHLGQDRFTATNP